MASPQPPSSKSPSAPTVRHPPDRSASPEHPPSAPDEELDGSARPGRLLGGDPPAHGRMHSYGRAALSAQGGTPKAGTGTPTGSRASLSRGPTGDHTSPLRPEGQVSNTEDPTEAARLVNDIRAKGAIAVADTESDLTVGDANESDKLWLLVRAAVPDRWRRIAAQLPDGDRNSEFLLAAANLLQNPPVVFSPTALRSKIDKAERHEYSDHDRRAIVAVAPLALEILRSASSFLKPSRSAIKHGLGNEEEKEVALEFARRMPWSTIASVLEFSDETAHVASQLEELDFSARDRMVAIDYIEQLQKELLQFTGDTSSDAARGSGLIRAAIRIGVVTLIGSLVGAPLSALAVNDSVAKEMIKTGIAGLILGSAGELLHSLTNRQPAETVARGLQRACHELNFSLDHYVDVCRSDRFDRAGVELTAAQARTTAAIYALRIKLLQQDVVSLHVRHDGMQLLADLSQELDSADPKIDNVAKWKPRIQNFSVTLSQCSRRAVPRRPPPSEPGRIGRGRHGLGRSNAADHPGVRHAPQLGQYDDSEQIRPNRERSMPTHYNR